MGKEWKQWQTWFSWASKSLDGNCSHEIERCLLLGRKADKTRQSVKKQRHYFADKCLYSQIYGFSSSHIWMWKLDFIKKAECWRIDAFELWCWRRLLRVPWTERRSNKSILKEINPEYGMTDAEAPVLWPADAKSLLIGKDPDAGKDWRQEVNGVTEDDKERWKSLTQWTWVWANSERWWRTGKPSQVMKPRSFRTELEKRHQNCAGLTLKAGHGPGWRTGSPVAERADRRGSWVIIVITLQGLP